MPRPSGRSLLSLQEKSRAGGAGRGHGGPAGSVFTGNSSRAKDATLADYQSQMSLMTSSGYAMDLATNDDSSIRNFLRAKAGTV